MGLRRISAARNRKARNARRPLDLEMMERRRLMAVFTVTLAGDTYTPSGSTTPTPGTLRWAITQADSTSGKATINFSIGSGEATISPLTPLPTLSNPDTTIDGTTQPGYNSKTGEPLIVLDGSSVSSTGTQTVAGLSVTGGGSTIKGLVLENFDGFFEPGISLSGAPSDIVQDCYIGTGFGGLTGMGNSGDGIDVAASNCTIGGVGVTQGNVISGNSFDGIKVTANQATIQGNIIGLGADGSTDITTSGLAQFEGITLGSTVGNLIGGTKAGQGNVISGNTFDGIDIGSLGADVVTADVIEGNFIGTDATGLVADQDVVAITDGISITGASDNTIGGNTPAAANVISGNTQSGILLSGSGAQNNVISGNKIGVGVDGTTAVGNQGAGITVSGALNNLIGGTTTQQGNIIANNGSSGPVAGVNFPSGSVGSGDAILSNSIYANGAGGIFLSPGDNSADGVTSQPAPTLTAVASAAGQTVVSGTLSVAPSTGGNAQFVIQFFSNASADADSMFEGQTYLGQITVTADGSGNATFNNVQLPVGTAVGSDVTATATQVSLNNTSEFSAPATVTLAPTTDLVVTNQTSVTPLLLGQNEVYTITVTNSGPTDDTNVVYTGALDNNSTFGTASAQAADGTAVTPTQSGGVVTADLGTIPAGESATITITVSAVDTGTISLTSTANGDLIDSTPGNNTNVTVTVPVNPAADLVVGMTGTPNPVAVGTDLLYFITIQNNGPNDATNVTATDTLPAGVSILDVNPSQGGFVETGNTVSFTLGTISANSAVTISIDVDPSAPGMLSNTVSASSTDVADPDLGNNSATVSTSVEEAVNLSIADVATPNPGTINQPLTYNLSVSNSALAGSTISDATAVVVTDTLPTGINPADTSVTLSQGTYSIANGVVTIDFGAVAVGQTPTAAITVVPVISATYTNTATVSDSVELNVGTGATTVTTPVLVSPSDISVTVTANPGTASTGAPLTYTVTVTNNGPAAAPSVVLINQLPSGIAAGAQFITSQGTSSISGTKITGDLGTIASGQSATLTIVVVPTISGPLYDIAGAASSDIDPNPANNIVGNVTLASPVGLVIFGNASTATPTQGDSFVYGYTVVNFGPATSSNTGVTIALPANTTYDSSSISQGFTIGSSASHTVLAIIGNLAPGAYATVFITVTPTATGSLVSAGTASTTNFNTNAANDVAFIANTAANHPGTFALSASSYAGPENGGSIPITIDRLNGTQGAIAVTYTTVAGTAVSGVNYTPTSGTVTFAAGQTSATVDVPVKDDGQVDGNFTFSFAITSVNNGASLGSPSSAPVTIVNSDRDLTPPQVLSVEPVVSGNEILAYVVDFNKPLNATAASNPANYGLFLSGRDLGTANAFIPVGAAYNAANFSVTLVPSQPVVLNAFYGLMINGSNAAGVTDVSGNLLSGDGSGVAGRNYDALIGFGNSLNYYDANNDVVHLATAGVEMEVVRNFSGNAYELQLFGNTGNAVIAGSVSGGSTSIAEVDGLGPFGSVNANGLTTPPFDVDLSEFTAALPVPQSIATAVIVGETIPDGPGYVLARLRASAG